MMISMVHYCRYCFALVNALKVVGKKPEDVTVVVSGTGL